MNIKNILKISLGAAIVAATQISCVHDDNWDAPEITCTNKFDAPTKTMAQVVEMVAAGDTLTIPNKPTSEPIIFDGYVVSSDESGNFYKTISFQDKPENPTMGLQIEVNKSMNYADFPVGSHIRIKANGLVLGTDAGVVKLGARDPNYRIGRLPQTIIGRYMSGVCTGNGLEIVNIVPQEVTLAQAAAPKYVNTLVKVKNVQFGSNAVGKLLMDKDASGTFVDTNRDLVDTSGGAILRTDGFFKATTYAIPNKSGEITFVVSKFNSTYQNVIRNVSDINLTKDRFATGILGGSAITYSGAFTENFESYAVDFSGFPKYLNYSYVGTPNRYWQVKTFSNNKYIQMSANAGSGSYQTFFIVPVDFTAANTLAFRVNVGFYNGDALKVYTTTNYTPGSDISTATLTDITSSFTIPKTPTTGYGTLAPAGTYNLPAALTGNGFIVFKYEGANPGVTTTIQLDDIVVN
ncbi:DUF5689 domain-containing protein [Epilithonimonas sp. JDS]|uniref:DUF5689 domain-containing protein n=1 Tax=Epilithonimonas sp. JDS TaxID=2902797 RepID=UPI001E4CDD1F|nr:DUF5689 domain-containing protein [Epilithonimonas sp. JDS]MCD9856478.1 DUF5689 domain-containing protein [Epilithonimonas sp. JDS]